MNTERVIISRMKGTRTCVVVFFFCAPQYTYPGAQVIPVGAQVTEELSFSRTLEGHPLLPERHPPDPAVSPTFMRAHFKCHLIQKADSASLIKKRLEVQSCPPPTTVIPLLRKDGNG